MNNKTKLIAGTSITSIIIAVVHVLHGLYSVGGASTKNNITILPMKIILTDSSGKKDTLLYAEYLKKDSLRKGNIKK